jgi:hypothetical protein
VSNGLLERQQVETSLQINYYWDAGCTDYATQFNLEADAQGGCINGDVAGSSSANIANCNAEYCICIFYELEYCGGQSWEVDVGYGVNPNCVNDGGSGVAVGSFECEFPDPWQG